MKKLILSVLLALALALPVHAQNTILVVDIAGVFNNMTEVRTEMAKLQSAADEAKGVLNDKATAVSDLQKQVEDLNNNAQNTALPAESRDVYKKKLQDAINTLKEKNQEALKWQQDTQTTIQNDLETIQKDALVKIRAVVKDIAKKKNATLVVNSANVGLGSAVIYNGDTADITKDVVDKLNAEAASATAEGGSSTTMGPSTSSKPATGTSSK